MGGESLRLARPGGLAGAGLLIVFTDVAPEDEADYSRWYNREHIDELLTLPGFRRARRYASTAATPRFLAVYEVEDIGVLAAPAYLDLLADQSPWSQRIIARFTSHERLCCRVSVDAARGLGGAIGIVRIDEVDDRTPMRRHLGQSVLPRIIARFDLHGAVFAENDPEIVDAPACLRGVGLPGSSKADSLILVEGAEDAAVDAAMRALSSEVAMTPGARGARVASIGSYRLLYMNNARPQG